MKKILAVGAFERDNFGDLLFLRILRDYTREKNVEIIPSSIIFSDMRSINGEIVYPYKLMLNLYAWDAVWVVGGEVGGVDINSAILMDAVDENGKIYQNLDNDEREAYRKLLSIPDDEDGAAYLPNLDEYTRNKRTKMIVNSVGLSNSNLKNDIKVLSNANVSVREEKSVEFCKSNNVSCSLSPDVVSLISYYHPVKISKKDKPYIVVQINQQLLRETDLDKLVASLKEISNLLAARIVLLQAGVTYGHDDSSFYQKITAKYNLLKPKYKINQFSERDPLQISELIARSKLCIATSLHCRIISESYGVPRISLVNNKVTNYVSTWEDGRYPYNIKVEDLVDTVKSIKAIINTPIANDGMLCKKAMSNIDRLYGSIGSTENQHKFNVIDEDALIEYAKPNKSILDKVFSVQVKQRDLYDKQISALNFRTKELEQQVEEHKDAINNILGSKSYMIGRLVTYPYRFIHVRGKGGENDK